MTTQAYFKPIDITDGSLAEVFLLAELALRRENRYAFNSKRLLDQYYNALR